MWIITSKNRCKELLQMIQSSVDIKEILITLSFNLNQIWFKVLPQNPYSQLHWWKLLNTAWQQTAQWDLQAALEPTVQPLASSGDSSTNYDPSREKKWHQIQMWTPHTKQNHHWNSCCSFCWKLLVSPVSYSNKLPSLAVGLELCDVPHVQSPNSNKTPGAAKPRG